MKNQPFIEAYRNFRFRNSPETLRYFYHPDHIGSTSWVTDSAKNGIQYCEYLPFGEPFLDQRSTTWSSRYTFSGKERDNETGYSYFGARYYNADLSIWLSVDPMADKYPNLTPYAYCGNNPIVLVDPDGRDWYTADEDGNISLYKKIEGSETDFLVVLNRKGEVRVDKNGNPKKSTWYGKQISQEVSKGIFSNNIRGENGHGNTLLDFKGNKSEARGVFNILSDNTIVEWGIVGYKEGEKEIYNVGSSHSYSEEASASQVALKKAPDGNLILYDHSHPFITSGGIWQAATGGNPSNNPDKGNDDTSFWKELKSGSPDVKLGIRYRRQTIRY